jgi:hypothetical protein
MLSSGFVTPQPGAGSIVYNGVPSPTPPAAIVQASITSSTTLGTSMTFPIDLDLNRMPYLSLQLLQFSSYTLLTSGNNLQTTPATSQGMFYLPIPRNLVDANKVEMSKDSLFKELSTLAAGGIGALAGGVLGGLTKSVAGVMGGAAEGAGIGLWGLNTAMEAANIVGVKNGGAINPFKVLLLKGPEFKEYAFSWIFAPRNPTEAQLLSKMLKTFNDAKTPTLGQGGLWYNYPYLFKPAFAQVDQGLMYQFKPSVLTNMTVEYNPGGPNSWLRGINGAGGGRMPNFVGVQMAFIEAELWSGGQFGSNLPNPNASSVNQGIDAAVNAVSSIGGSPAAQPGFTQPVTTGPDGQPQVHGGFKTNWNPFVGGN